ncbi:hypothetical protein FQN60_014419 [Etheostoma spectabile]|uniref:Uncharacterized protein n=1 Tax=Etheostoma spectabile TaxID=54343 RepID=A0A5J5DCB3_9PERO|nr:hypothetical protein FQN60_014419 [Etheostoma spectabile]
MSRAFETHRGQSSLGGGYHLVSGGLSSQWSISKSKRDP